MAMPFGNARFASAEEVRAHGLLTADSGAMPLGFLIENGELTGQPVGNPLRQNAVLIGPSGSGKTTRVFIPFALHGRGERSVIWVDPKGDIGAVAGRLRAKVGSFYSINPRGVLADRPGYEDLKSCGFNVLKSLRSASPSFDADVGGLAEALIPMAGEQPFWPLMARALVSGLIMGEVIDAEAHACRPSLSRVRDELADVERLPQRLAELAHYRHRGLRNKVRPLLQKARSVMDVISTAASETEFLDDPEIAADLATDGGLDFASLRERPTTVCITVPAGTMERDSKWLRLTLSAALRDLMQAPEAGQLPVTIILDEYFLIANGGLKIIEQAWAFVRGFGIQLLVALQDLPQLQDLYPRRWSTFLGNADVIMALGPNELTTAEWMSKRAGDTTDIVQSASAGDTQGLGWDDKNMARGNTGRSGGVSYSQTRVPFLSVADLFDTPEGQLYVWKKGLANTIATYAPIYADRSHALGLHKAARPSPYFTNR